VVIKAGPDGCSRNNFVAIAERENFFD